MSQNRLGIATMVLVVLAGLTYWRINARYAEDKAPPKVEAKLPKIEKDKLDELEFAAADKPTVRIVKKGDEWRLAEPIDARADQDAIKAALDKLGELELTGVAATKAQNHERLEVDKKKGTHVIARASGKPVLDAWVGTYQSGNTMLRLDGQDLVATVKGSIRYVFNKGVREWRDRNIVKLDGKDLKEMVFDNKNGHFDFVREGDDWKQVLGKKEKKLEPLDQGKLKSLVGTATSVTALDFADPSMTPAQAGLAPGAGTLALKLGGDAGARQELYRIGAQKDQDYYFQREGTDTIFVISSWVGGRFLAGPDAFINKPSPPSAANAAPNPLPLGSPGNPIPVEPYKSEVVKKLQAESDAHHMAMQPAIKPATPPPAAPAAAKPAPAAAAAKPAAQKK